MKKKKSPRNAIVLAMSTRKGGAMRDRRARRARDARVRRESMDDVWR